MKIFFGLALLAAAGAAAGQETKAEPPEERPASPVLAPAPRLNLKLDNPARYTTETPQESAGKTDALPSLGSNARPMPVTPMPTTTRPFPADTERPEPR